MNESQQLRLSAWKEWKAKCQLDLCRDTVAGELRTFIDQRMRHSISRISARASVSSISDPWHCFESFMFIKQARGGKRWKDWIFSRGGLQADHALLACIESGVALIVRDVVRDHLSHELPRAHELSADKPFDEGSSNSLLTLYCSHVDVFDDVAQAEYQSIAEQYADDIQSDLSQVIRAGLAARYNGIPLSDERVQQQAGCRKSVLSDRLRRFISSLAEECRKTYPDDSNDCVLTLVMLIVRELSRRSAISMTLHTEIS